MCKVSVVTSVYNCEKYIGKTIESVIDQTYTDWEFIIINDCSKDRSAEIIQSYRDKRIKFINNVQNKGQCRNLNYGISIARGEYIARLDHDDICYPSRFEEQVRYMDEHRDVVLLGTWMDNLIDGKTEKLKRAPIRGANEVRFSHSFFNYCVPHSSFMIRKQAMLNNGIKYEGKYLYAEDYDLILHMVQVGKVDALENSLIAYRIFPEQCSQVYSNGLIQSETDEIRSTYIDVSQQIIIPTYCNFTAD